MVTRLLVVALLWWGCVASCLAVTPSELREGDLLFVVNRSGNAITQVTSGLDSLPIDHVAVFHRIGGEDGLPYVIEAVPRRGVTLTPLDSVAGGGEGGSVIACRVANLDAAASVRAALRYVGAPYDHFFVPDAEAIYCSELVQLCYVDEAGEAVFDTIPMSFHDASGRITDYWRQHYAAVGLDVPEGAPGTNPGQLSRSPRVTVLGTLRP